MPNPWTSIWFNPPTPPAPERPPVPDTDKYVKINDRYVRRGDNEGFIIIDSETHDIVGAAVAEEDDPGWWRCHIRGKPDRKFVPLDHPDPARDIAWRLTR
ncbi:hypothetical protein [Actinomadura litoris]|uniref:Uncharacterized protein n=1 Tax=Actinomadura litoris TaxID=2678616 RepID=A0A7K1LAC8_9ACTN|nr:hypothetical protein [Actinomadura litoris]MUN41374.1 hypothetical protein [Actinomadura litoris]